MIVTLAVDPALVHPAACLAIDNRIVRAQRVKLRAAWSKLDRGQRVLEVARAIREWYRLQVNLQEILSTRAPDYLVCEWMQIYPHGKGKGDPNQLLPLVGIDMALAGLLEPAYVITPTPHEWIGTIPKDTEGEAWLSPRGQFIRRRVTPQEFERIDPNHDSIDATGLAMFQGKRLKQIRLLPGAV